MTTNLPSRQQVERAQPLDFPERQPAERSANITIEVAPDGLHIRCEYTGSLSSIPAAVERLRAAGVLDLVKPSAAPAAPSKPKVEPLYKPDGTACCPVHNTPLSQGQYGLYCSSKAKPGESANAKGYCNLKFES